jgi:hypothetical protein
MWKINFWDPIFKEAAVSKEGHTESRRKAEHRQQQWIIKFSNIDVNLLKIIKGPGPEPAIKLSKVEAVEAEVAYGALVLGENLGHNLYLLGTIPRDMGSVEAKWSGAP